MGSGQSTAAPRNRPGSDSTDGFDPTRFSQDTYAKMDGFGYTPPGFVLATIEQARTDRNKIIPLIGEWEVCRLDGGKISGSGYNFEIEEGSYPGLTLRIMYNPNSFQVRAPCIEAIADIKCFSLEQTEREHLIDLFGQLNKAGAVTGETVRSFKQKMSSKAFLTKQDISELKIPDVTTFPGLMKFAGNRMERVDEVEQQRLIGKTAEIIQNRWYSFKTEGQVPNKLERLGGSMSWLVLLIKTVGVETACAMFPELAPIIRELAKHLP